MLTFSSNYIQARAQKVLHLIYYKDKKNPNMQRGVGSIQADTHTVFRVGEHLTSFQWLLAFPCILMHPITPQLFGEYLQSLLRYKFDEWLNKYIRVPHKSLIIIGNSVRLMAEEPTVLGRTAIRGAKTAPKTITYEKGLNILTDLFEPNFDPKIKDPIFTGNIAAYSRTKRLFLMDPDVVCSSTDIATVTTKFGSLYKAEDAKVTKITEMEDPKTQTDMRIVKSREIAPMRRIYDDPDTKEQEKEAEVGTSKVVNKET